MANFEDDLLRDAEDDLRTVEYIKSSLPQELKDKFTDDALYYFLDVLGEYYVELIEASGGGEAVDIDVEAVAAHLARQASKDGMGDYDAQDLRWVVDAELDYGEAQDAD